MKKILVLEDEANIRSFVVINLNRAGYETIEAGSGEEALEQLRLNPDVGVALLDIMLPDMDGFEVCRRIRAGNSKIGIIMLTARTQEMDKVTGFMTGADDYVTKPFSPAELTARIDALYSRILHIGKNNHPFRYHISEMFHDGHEILIFTGVVVCLSCVANVDNLIFCH